jgi:nicotinate-nucleotide pyrophosphorylase (carboxylating)
MEEWNARFDAERFEKGDLLASFSGQARAVLTGERVALNFLQHLSGVATLTAAFCAEIEGTRARIVDTRKTTPLLRKLERAAVVHGGGTNHRFNLATGVLIKENHIAAAGGLTTAVHRARAAAPHLMKIEVEVRDLIEFDEALHAGADVILLDNMPVVDMAEAVQRAQGRNLVIEASGNMSLERVRAVADTGVDLISIGALTHSTKAIDLSLLVKV